MQISARLENIKSLEPDGSEFRWYFRVRCGNCNWETDQRLYVTQDEKIELRRAHVNLAMKCHLCSREITIGLHILCFLFNFINLIAVSEIVPHSIKPYTDTEEKFQNIVEFDCRGGEPFDFFSPVNCFFIIRFF